MSKEETAELLIGTVSVLEEKLTDLGVKRSKATDDEPDVDPGEVLKQWVTDRLKKLS